MNPELRLEGGHGVTAKLHKCGGSGVRSLNALIGLLAPDYNFLRKRALMKCYKYHINQRMDFNARTSFPEELKETLFNLPIPHCLLKVFGLRMVHMAKMVIIIGHSLTYTCYQPPMSFPSKEH